jgi:hypothetical protein
MTLAIGCGLGGMPQSAAAGSRWTWSTTGLLSPHVRAEAPRVAYAGRNRYVIAYTTESIDRHGAAHGTVRVVDFARGPTPPRIIARLDSGGYVRALSVNRRGDAVAVVVRPWDEDPPVWAVVRQAGRWRQPQLLNRPGRGYAGSVGAAIDGAGKVTVAFTSYASLLPNGQLIDPQLDVVTEAPGAAAFSQREVVPSPRGTPREIAVATTTTGETNLIWRAEHDEGSYIEASRRNAGASEFAYPNDIAVGTKVENMHFALNHEGDAAVAWVEALGTRTQVKMLTRSAFGAFSDPQAVSRRGVSDLDTNVALNDRGDVALIWKDGLADNRAPLVLASGTIFGRRRSHARVISKAAPDPFTPTIALNNRRDVAIAWRRWTPRSVLAEAVVGSQAHRLPMPTVLAAPRFSDASGLDIALSTRRAALVAWLNDAYKGRIQAAVYRRMPAK